MSESGAGRVVILSGPIGAGKTTVAAELVKAPARPTAYIEGDAFWKFIAKAKPGPRQEAFRIILKSMSATAAAFAREGYEAVLDFSMPPEFLERGGGLFRELEVHWVVLRPEVEVCVERAATRPRGAIRNGDGVRDFYQLFTRIEARHIVVNDGVTPAETAQRIRAGLEAGEYVWRPAAAAV